MRVQQVAKNGEKSSWSKVTSGIPHGSVLEPLLFVIFINDLPNLVKSDTYLFADDTKNIISKKEDTEQLQNDLNKLSDWSDTWLFRIHPEKCKYMHIGKPGPNIDQQYTLNAKTLIVYNVTLPYIPECTKRHLTLHVFMTFTHMHISNVLKAFDKLYVNAT